MRRLPVLVLLLGSSLVFAQSTEDLYNSVLAFRVVGKWNGHLHFAKMPDGNPTDYYGTVDAKQGIGMHVEATVKIDVPGGGRPIEARGILGSEDGLEVDGTPVHELNSVFYWSGDHGYLPMRGALKNGRLILQGDRVPTDPNGGTWRTRVDFKSRDEIDITFLGKGEVKPGKEPLGYIKLTRQPEVKD